MKKLLLFILILLLPKLASAEFNLTNSSTATAQTNWNNHTDGALYGNVTVTSVVGVTGSTADDLSDNTTAQLAENTNLYFTNERVDDRAADLIKNGTGITWAYDDAGNTLTPTVTITQYTDALAVSAVLGLSNLTNYFTKTEANSTYFQLSTSISGNNITNLTWTKIDNIPSYTTSNQATNTTSDVVFANVNATTLKGDGGNITGLPAGGNASYSTLGGSTADNLTVVVSAGLIKDSGVAKASLASISTVVGLSNLTNYLNITQSNSTYFNHTAGVPWANVTSVPANTTSDQAVNTTSEVVFAKVTVNGNLTGNLQSQIKTIGFVGLNTTTNTTLWETNKNLTLTRVSASVVKGTNMTFMLYACNDTGYGGCIPCNGTAGWNAVNQTQLVITDLPNATVVTGNYTRMVVSAITGPLDGSINIYYNEVP